MVWGPWWPRYPGHSGPRSGSSLDGVHRGPRLNLGLSGQFQRFDPRQIDAVNHREPVLAPPRTGLDQDAFLQKPSDRPLDGRLAQFRMSLDGPFGTPDARTIVRGLIRQEHNDLLARCAAKLPIRACVCDPPAHWITPKGAKTCEFCTGFVRDFRRFSRIRRESSREFLQTPAQSPVNKPYFSGVFGDPGRIRTCNLPLRRGLLYPIEPRDHDPSLPRFLPPVNGTPARGLGQAPALSLTMVQ